MASDTKPDNATGDSVNSAILMTRVYALMASILVFLGFSVAPTDTIATMLETLTQWLDGAKKIRHDPQGATARIWWEAFKVMWTDPEVSTANCALNADRAAAEFGKRFLPVADDERDTLNTSDFEAIRAELDASDHYKQEICDALNGAAGKRRFVHAGLIDDLRAERDDLKRRLQKLPNALARLDGDASDEDATEALKQVAECADDRDKALNAERDELKRALAGAIVPLPKPERVEPGQRWAFIMTAIKPSEIDECSFRFVDGSGWHYSGNEIDREKAYYLGMETR